MLVCELNTITNLFYNNSNSFSLINSYNNELLHLFKNKSLTKFKQKDIEKYLQFLRRKGNKNTTINTKLSYLSKCLKYFKNSLVIPYQKITTTPKQTILNNDFKQLLINIMQTPSPINNELIQFLQLAYYTGLRANEILNIKKVDIKYQDNNYFLNLYNTKNHQDNFIPLHSSLMPVITNFKEFTIPYKKLYYELKKHNITPHQFRHTFITNCFENGLDSFTTMKLVNHKSINSTKKYIHLKNKFLSQELERLKL